MIQSIPFRGNATTNIDLQKHGKKEKMNEREREIERERARESERERE